MAGTLETLLERVRDGVASVDEVAQARSLVAHDARLPEELREVALRDDDDLEADAVGLLAVLGADPLFGDVLREALDDEAASGDFDEVPDGWEVVATALREGLVAMADGVDVADAVMHRIPAPSWAWGPALADAVRAEAGEVDVADAVMASLGAEAFAPVADAVHAEAGEVDVADAVMASLGAEAFAPVADAVRAEAGEVDVADAVLAELAPAAAAMPPAVQTAPAVPAQANGRWAMRAFLAAAVALLAVGVSQGLMGGETNAPGGAEIVFAAAGDVVVEDLDYADDVVVMQAEGDEGAVILWMEDV